MCGINLLFNIAGTAVRMNDLVRHRGPDSETCHEFQGPQKVSLGMTRLAIRDLRKNLYPLANEDKKIYVVYNGEIYNDKRLKAFLENRGHKFKTESDGEVIVHLYEEYGSDCFEKLEGQFAIIIYDFNKKKVILARDSFGIKPLYYMHNKINGINTLIASSELKAIINMLKQPEIDPLSKRDFFSLLYVPAPHTIIKGVKKLEPGSVLECSDKKFINKRFFQYSVDSDPFRIEPKKLKDTLQDAVEKRLVSDVPLGCFLSGGLDSSLIASLASQSVDKLKTFSIAYPEDPRSEEHYAREVAQYLGTKHYCIKVYPKDIKLSLIRKLVYHMDEPFADESFIPTYLLSKATRNHVTVALSGDGADELFLGYQHVNFLTKLNRFKLPFLKDFPVFNEFTRKIRKYGQLSSMSLASQYKIFSSYENRHGRMKGLSQLDSIEKMPNVDVANFLVDDGLTKVDRMSMANSLEVRTPFLDSRVATLSKVMPIDQKLGKQCWKDVAEMYKLIPTSVIQRQKQGFLMPSSIYLDVTKSYIPKNLNISGFSKHKQDHIKFANAIYNIWLEAMNMEDK